MTAAAAPVPATPGPAQVLLRAALVVVALYFFAVAVTLMGSAFKLSGKSAAEGVLEWAQNPLLGLFAGIFMTAVVQSSSTVTTMIVTAVAGGLVPIPVAVPMVMGANIGTTVTNTLVAMGSVVRTDEFRRSLEAATVHDFFNFMCVVLLLPIEVGAQALGVFREPGTNNPLGPLGWVGEWIAHFAEGSESQIGLEKGKGGIGFLFKKPATAILDGIASAVTGGEHATAKGLGKAVAAGAEGLSSAQLWTSGLAVLVGLIVLSVCLIVISKNMKAIVLGPLEGALQGRLLNNVAVCICLGVVMTVLVQSSSITTSLLVPVAAAGLLKIRQVFHFTLGANIGTTCTGLLAALFLVTSGESGAALGLAIACVHALFNVTGTALVLIFKPLHDFPLRLAAGFAAAAVKRRLYALGYLLGVFFALPGLLLVVWRLVQTVFFGGSDVP